jgi:hypothetical protein
MASSMDGPMNRSAQRRHRPSFHLLSVYENQMTIAGQRTVSDDQLESNGLAATGSPPMSMLRSARVASQLTLLEEIRQAGADDSRAVVIMPVWEQDSVIWHREFADALADRLDNQQTRARGSGTSVTKVSG